METRQVFLLTYCLKGVAHMHDTVLCTFLFPFLVSCDPHTGWCPFDLLCLFCVLSAVWPCLLPLLLWNLLSSLTLGYVNPVCYPLNGRESPSPNSSPAAALPSVLSPFCFLAVLERTVGLLCRASVYHWAALQPHQLSLLEMLLVICMSGFFFFTFSQLTLVTSARFPLRRSVLL